MFFKIQKMRVLQPMRSSLIKFKLGQSHSKLVRTSKTFNYKNHNKNRKSFRQTI